MKTLVIGAPVYERGWILEEWFEHLLDNVNALDENMVVVPILNYADSEDETIAIIHKWTDVFDGFEIIMDHGNDHEKQRAWRYERYVTMARLRNRLLEEVRKIEPDYYLSCDTDMLLAPGTLGKLIKGLDMAPLGGPSFDGIAPLAYMTPRGTEYPNAMNSDFQTRPPIVEGSPEVLPVTVCFGTVLMRPSLYAIDYAPDNMGEDIGWGKLAMAEGKRMALHTGAKVKHVMAREMLREVDPRVGY